MPTDNSRISGGRLGRHGHNAGGKCKSAGHCVERKNLEGGRKEKTSALIFSVGLSSRGFLYGLGRV
jgi:hypothetical protein